MGLSLIGPPNLSTSLDCLRESNLWVGGFVIFHFLDDVKMENIYRWYLQWYFPIRSAHSIFVLFSRENNKIIFLESPSSLFKGVYELGIGITLSLSVHLFSIENLARRVLVDPKDKKTVGVIVWWIHSGSTIVLQCLV